MRTADRATIALAAVSLAAGLFFTSRPAMAAIHHHHFRRHYSRHVARITRGNFVHATFASTEPGNFFFTPFAGRAPHERRRYSDARPREWCGWEMRRLVGSDPGPSYNLARNWKHWGRPGPAGIGAVVVWPHHVAKIVGQENGEWVMESGNDGHAFRTRPRSTAGAIAIRWD